MISTRLWTVQEEWLLNRTRISTLRRLATWTVTLVSLVTTSGTDQHNSSHPINGSSFKDGLARDLFVFGQPGFLSCFPSTLWAWLLVLDHKGEGILYWFPVVPLANCTILELVQEAHKRIRRVSIPYSDENTRHKYTLHERSRITYEGAGLFENRWQRLNPWRSMIRVTKISLWKPEYPDVF